MNVDRRQFLKGLAATWVATGVVSDVYGLTSEEVEFMLPADSKPGVYKDLMVRIHGNNKTVVWPSNIKWQGSERPSLSEGMDVLHFETWDGGENWYGTYSLDLQ